MLDIHKARFAPHLFLVLVLLLLDIEKQIIFGQTTRRYSNSNPQYNYNPYNRPFGGQNNGVRPRPQQQQQLLPETATVNCPERNIRLETADCNKYIECANGNGTLKVCPDGLFYNTNASFFAYPCSYDFEVDCGNRNKPASTSSSELCPYGNGYFFPDRDKCNRFVVCTYGTPHKFKCPKGLAIDEKLRTCRWPDEVPGCDASKYLGVTCPGVGDIRNSFNAGFDKYPYGDDCIYYYICIGGSPRLLSCPANKLFNPDTALCESIETFSCRSSTAIDSRSFVNPNSNYRNNYQNPNRNNRLPDSRLLQSQQKRRFRRRLVKRTFKNGIKISESFI